MGPTHFTKLNHFNVQLMTHLLINYKSWYGILFLFYLGHVLSPAQDITFPTGAVQGFLL
jgi:hypothetical protein